MYNSVRWAAVAAVLLLLGAGCSNPVSAGMTKPYVSVTVSCAGRLRYPPSYAVWVQTIPAP